MNCWVELIAGARRERVIVARTFELHTQELLARSADPDVLGLALVRGVKPGDGGCVRVRRECALHEPEHRVRLFTLTFRVVSASMTLSAGVFSRYCAKPVLELRSEPRQLEVRRRLLQPLRSVTGAAK